MTTVGAAFDRLASRYDELWTSSPNGRVQREAVWRRIDGLFRPGDHILDLGCGIGDDAVHFMSRGVEVLGIDASAEMVRIARSRGVEAISCQLSAVSSQLSVSARSSPMVISVFSPLGPSLLLLFFFA